MGSVETLETTTFSGRRFTRKQLAQIQDTVHTFQNLSRNELAATLCEHFSWVTPGNTHKIPSCLVLLEELEARQVIVLPEKRKAQKPNRPEAIIVGAEGEPELVAKLEEVEPIELQRVQTKEDRVLFEDYLRKYHYLGYGHAFGSNLGYFVVSKKLNRKLGCILFSGSAARILAPRDKWIGWDDKHRRKLLHQIINQSRFLIFPWCKIPNLSSRTLSLMTGQVGKDWLSAFGHQPVLIETYVDTTKYRGTCYQAANWRYLGETKGRGRSDPHNKAEKTIKDIYVYPLVPDVQHQLRHGDTQTSKLKKKYRNDVRQSHSRNVDGGFVHLWENVIQIVSDVAEQYDDKWRIRKRLMNSLLLLLFIFRLVSTRRTQSYGATIDELWDSCEKLHLPLPQKSVISPSAFCEARKKLSEEAFQTINRKIVEAYEKTTDSQYRWFGHRLFAVDGSKINLPRTLISLGYAVPSGNANYPQGLLSCLYQLQSKIPYDFALWEHNNERTAAEEHLKPLLKDDVVVYDRGYFSYVFLKRHIERQVHGVFRLQGNSYKVIQDFFSSDETDKIVELSPTASVRSQIQKEHPDVEITPFPIRLLKYRFEDTTYCLATTLLDPQYTNQHFSDVYHARWGIEELYKTSKETFEVEDFHAKTVRGVKQELYAHFVLITMNRFFANRADTELNSGDAQKTPDSKAKPGRIQTNFRNCVHVFSRSLEALLLFHETVKSKVRDAFRVIAGRYQRVRPGRSYERKSMKPIRKWQPSKKTRRKRASTALPHPV